MSGIASASATIRDGPQARDSRRARASRLAARAGAAVELACELLECAGGVGAVDGRPGDEDARSGRAARASVRSVSSHHSSFAWVAELGEVGLRDEDVELARLGHQLERARVDDGLASATAHASSGFPGAR